MPSPVLIAALLMAVCFTLATWLSPRVGAWSGTDVQSPNMLALLLGDARRLFANHFFAKADVYFHSGYYPSIFDRKESGHDTSHLAGEHVHDEHCGHDDHAEDEHEKEMDFLGQPSDWIERFGRNFQITDHTHLEGGGREREMLPWLRLAAELDPEQVETYTVAAYWLRSKLGKITEAEQFLREGLRANPHSHEILFEIGRLYDENYKQPDHARNVWELALAAWDRREAKQPEPDVVGRRQIITYLARLEEREGLIRESIAHLELLFTSYSESESSNRAAIRKQIEELTARLAPPGRGNALIPPVPAPK